LRLLEPSLVAPRDDDGVSELQKLSGELESNAARTAGDQNRVA